ncbi:response regulator [Robinsoniella peoriensis]|uniref:response regulator transcription factor n=1 Tax=Robinsoniella peoriensis TaxID=180332 RepID=UPI003751462E
MIKVLIVEDEIYSRQSLIKQIKEYDTHHQFAILEASNGEKGLELYRQERPELIFTDIRMPKMDGLTLLHKMKKMDSKVNVIMISAFADFQYAKTSLNQGAEGYLLKPISDEELKEQLSKFVRQNNIIKEKVQYTDRDMVTRYIYQNIKSEEIVQDFVSESMFHRIFAKYQFLNIYFEGNHQPDQEELVLRLRGIYDMEIWTGFRCLFIQKQVCSLVISVDHQTGLLQRKILKLLLEQGYICRIGISKIQGEASCIKEAYQQAMAAVTSKIFYKEHLLFYEVIENERNHSFQMSDKQRDFLLISLGKGNRDMAYEILGDMLADINKDPGIDIDSIEILMVRLTVIFNQVLEGEKENAKMKHAKLKFQLLDFQNLDDLRDAVQKKIDFVCRQRGRNQRENQTDIINAMKKYAEVHYHQDISMKELAENVFFLNPTYLSHMFAEKTGISFSTYIRKVRIEKAKQFLSDDRYSITEIASLSGYNDTSQFIRVFRQELGTTPKKYREKL